MSHALARAVFLILTLPLLAGCANDPLTWYYQPAVYQIRSDLPLGSSVERVDAYLTHRDIEHSYFRRSHQMTALIHNVRRDALVQSDLTLTFFFNEYRGLTDIQFDPAYTKP